MDHKENVAPVPVDRFVDATQVCDRLGISRPTMYRRIADGTIPRPVKLGRLSRWSSSDLDSIIRNLADEVR